MVHHAVEREPRKPPSSTRRPDALRAVWRCFGGAARSEAGHPQTRSSYSPVAGLSLARLTGGSGDGVAEAYFATVFLLMPRAEAISLCEQPRIAISLCLVKPDFRL